MADTPQSFQNHTRWDPLFHFVLVPLFLLNFIVHCVDFVRLLLQGGEIPWVHSLGSLVVSLAILLLAFKTRLYALKVQDRVIRLEERLRLQSILPEPLRSRIPELTVPQLIGLRFASDSELTSLVQAALDNKMDIKQIKQAVRTWRPDNFRV
jgi:uncharacterized integral membrane protein